MKDIYIFGGQGADFRTISESLKLSCPNNSIKIVTKDDLLSDDFNLDKVAAFILPGASQGEYDAKLGDNGFKAIKNYVHSGGTFAGFCAGAYYASSKIEWRIETPEKRKEKTPNLKFFNGIARGPVQKLLEQNNPNWDWKQASAANITITSGSTQSKIKSLYWGGPHFIGDEKDFEVLARFDDIEGAPPCLMQKYYGRGQVILSSIHPEVSVKQLETFAQSGENTPEYIAKVAEELAPYEDSRQKLWSELVRTITNDKKAPSTLKNNKKTKN